MENRRRNRKDAAKKPAAARPIRRILFDYPLSYHKTPPHSTDFPHRAVNNLARGGNAPPAMRPSGGLLGAIKGIGTKSSSCQARPDLRLVCAADLSHTAGAKEQSFVWERRRLSNGFLRFHRSAFHRLWEIGRRPPFKRKSQAVTSRSFRTYTETGRVRRLFRPRTALYIGKGKSM